MIRRIIAAIAVTAIGTLGAVSITTAANAAPATPTVQQECLKPLPEDGPVLSLDKIRLHRACRQVTVVNNCDGTRTVTLANAAELPAQEAEFRIGDETRVVQGQDSTDIVLPFAPAPDDMIVVESRFGDGPWRAIFNVALWERPNGCWKITAVSTCDHKIALTARNLAPVQGIIGVQPDTSTAVPVIVAANATFLASYQVDTLTVVTKLDDTDGTNTFNWSQPGGCVTPPPTTPPTTQAPPPPAAGLPVTGASMTMPIVGSVILLLLIAGAVVVAVRLRRRDGLDGI